MTVKSSTNKLLRKLLGSKNLLVTDHDLCPRKGVLKLLVKPHKNGALCPECGRRGKLLNRSPKQAARDSRTWRDIPEQIPAINRPRTTKPLPHKTLRR